MNIAFKVALIKLFGSQGEAARALGIRECLLSPLVRGHRLPTASERHKLLTVFSPYEVRKFFPRSKQAAKNYEKLAQAKPNGEVTSMRNCEKNVNAA